MRNRTIVALAATLFSTAAAAAPEFVDRGPQQAAGHQYTGGWEHFVGGGVAVFDCNDDGFPEILAAGGDSRSTLLINRIERPGGTLRFEPSNQPALALSGITGAYPLDIDGDGITDLAVLRVGENRLLKGKARCTFVDANEAWRFDGLDGWTTAFSATWEDAREFPTLAFGNYVDRDDPSGPFFACDDNHLFRPEGRHYGPVERLTPGFCALSMLFTDWGRKGRQDLRISNDRHYFVRGGQEQLWRITPQARLYDETDGWRSLSIWGMGIASRDLDGDGLPEVFLTSMGDQKMRSLEAGPAKPTYEDVSLKNGTTASAPYLGNEGRPSTGWHAAFGDVDNNGLDDLFIAKGNVNQMPDAAMRDPNNLLLQLEMGRFVEHGEQAGIATTERARGAALVDLNRDGLLDLVINNRRAGLELHENVSVSTGSWLAVDIHQPKPNTDAVGAWIEVSDGHRTWHREITVGGGHAGGSRDYQHFGTGSSSDLKLRAIWPDGTPSPWYRVPARSHIRLERGQSPEVVNFSTNPAD